MTIRRRFRLWSLVAVASAAWTNRRDVSRWWRFLKRATIGRRGRPISDVLTEAKVRLAITTDPTLRRNKSFDDLSVDDGVVTLHTSASGWPDSGDQIDRLKQIKGITDVRPAVPAGARHHGSDPGAPHGV